MVKLASLYMIALVSMFGTQSEQGFHVAVRNNEIYVSDRTGQERQLTNDGMPKENVSMSLNGDMVIYNTPYDPYKPPREREPVMFSVVDTQTGKIIKQIPVIWAARLVSSVRWISNEYVMILGEGAYLAGINIKLGKQTLNLIGHDFSPSPDASMMVYRYDFNPLGGPIPDKYKSDYVLLSFVKSGNAADRISSEYDLKNFRVIFPEMLQTDQIQRKEYQDPVERVRIESGFEWSWDSQAFAFVEYTEEKIWLVVLGMGDVKGVFSVQTKRFELGTHDEKILSLSWMDANKTILVRGENVTRVVDLVTGAIHFRK